MLNNCLFMVSDKLALQWIQRSTDGKIHLVMSLQQCQQWEIYIHVG